VTETAPAPAATTATETAPAAATTGTAETAPAAATATTTETAPAVATTTTTEQAPAAATVAAVETAPATTTTEQVPAAATTTTTEQTPAAATTTTVDTAPAAATVQQVPAVDEAAAQKPTFDTVRVEKTGEAVIAGRAEAGAQVNVMLDGVTIGTATANSDGAFVVVPDKSLPEGAGALTIEAKAADQAVAVRSAETVAVMVPASQTQEALVAVISPDAPTKVLQKPEVPAPAETKVAETAPAETKIAEAAPAAATPAPALAVSLDAIDYDSAGNIMFSGKASTGTVVRLYVDNAVLADAQAGADTRWTYTATAPMAAGNHTLRADALDATGKVTSRVEIPFVREDQAKLAEAAPDQTQPEITTTTTEGGSAPATDGGTQPKAGRVVIQPGNNLWRISRVIYGTGTKYSLIYEANKDLIRNPDRIYPGQVFKTPDVVPPESIDPGRRDPLKPEESGSTGQ
jgi:nucleoid-associated protein YgaU